jgi:hypothetical protein
MLPAGFGKGGSWLLVLRRRAQLRAVDLSVRFVFAHHHSARFSLLPAGEFSSLWW